MFKKLAYFCLFLILVLGLTGQNKVLAENDVDLNEADRVSKELIEDYYLGKYKFEEKDFYKYVSHKSFGDYLTKGRKNSTAVLALDKYRPKVSVPTEQVEYFNLKLTRESVEDCGAYLHITYLAGAKYKYVLNDGESEFGEVIEVLVENKDGKAKVADMKVIDYPGAEKLPLSIDRWDIKKYPARIGKDLKDMDQAYKDKVKLFEKMSLENSIREEKKKLDLFSRLNSVLSIDRNAMVSYAKRTAGKKCSSYGYILGARGSSYAPNYFDFSSIRGNYDCYE